MEKSSSPPIDLNVVLIAPEIPQNTGAIGRLCVCLGAQLHLVRPLGFELDESRLRRAGLDYWQHLQYHIYDDWGDFLTRNNPDRLFFASTKGCRSYFEFAFRPTDYLVFGNESSGLPAEFYETYAAALYTIPMPGKHARSHNLANAVSVIMYEAYRQLSEF